MSRIIGAARHAQRLLGLRRGADARVARALMQAGHDIEMDAELSITRGSISGPGHIPSAPGEPPNADTRFLDGNIETKLERPAPPKVSVTSHAPYSAALEYGTEKMEARPYMRPALEKNREAIAKYVKGGINAVIRRS